MDRRVTRLLARPGNDEGMSQDGSKKVVTAGLDPVVHGVWPCVCLAAKATACPHGLPGHAPFGAARQ